MKEIVNSLKPGTLLRGTGGCYRIENALGQGSFGITYRASMVVEGKFSTVETGVQVAVKEFYMSDFCTRHESGTITGGGDSGLVEYYTRKFFTEARNLADLHHGNIVRVIDCFEAFGTAYYVMEYVQGTDLNDYLRRHGPMPEAEAVAAIRSVASALAYMHSRHMLHLDMKPSNVMRRDADGHLLLIDFGLSKRYEDSGDPESSTTIGLGTPGYAPIEQAKTQTDKNFSPTLDVYALGGTFYKLLTGQTPPDSSSVLNDGLPLEPLRRHHVSDRAVAVIQAAMQPRRKDRLQSVQEFLDILDGRLQASPANIDPERTETRPAGQTVDNAPTDPYDYVAAAARYAFNKHAAERRKKQQAGGSAPSRKTKQGADSKHVWMQVAGWATSIVLCVWLGFYLARSCRSNSSPQDTVMADSTMSDSVATDTFITNEAKEVKDARICVWSKGVGDSLRYTYTGPVDNNGLPEGKGKAVYENGRVYEGPFVGGTATGKDATYSYPNGDQFAGSFKNDCFEEGRYTVGADGSYFQGKFSGGQPYSGSWYSRSGKLLETLRPV